MAYPRVKGVVTQQGRDISALVNDLADQETMPPQVLVAAGIAESNLNEQAERYGTWPDISFGLWQQTVAYAPIGDQTNSASNIVAVRRALFDVATAGTIAAKQLGRFWRQYQDGPETLGRYNWPARGLQGNPNRANIERGWRESEAYVSQAPGAWSPVDVRDQFPFEGCELDTRPLSGIQEVIYHHGASPAPRPNYDSEMALIRQYHALHVSKGWCVLSYHFAIGPSGTAYYCNNLDLITYHATIANARAVGTCFLGNFTDAPPSEAMLDAAIRARLWVAAQCGTADLPYRGHKDVAGDTACPGGWWPGLRERLARLPAEPPPEPEPPPPPEDTIPMWWWTSAQHDTLEPSVTELRALATALRAGHGLSKADAATDAERIAGNLERLWTGT